MPGEIQAGIGGEGIRENSDMKHYLVLEAKGRLNQQILYPILGNGLVSLVDQARYINKKDPREQPRPLCNTGYPRIALADRDSHQIS